MAGLGHDIDRAFEDLRIAVTAGEFSQKQRGKFVEHPARSARLTAIYLRAAGVGKDAIAAVEKLIRYHEAGVGGYEGSLEPVWPGDPLYQTAQCLSDADSAAEFLGQSFIVAFRDHPDSIMDEWIYKLNRISDDSVRDMVYAEVEKMWSASQAEAYAKFLEAIQKALEKRKAAAAKDLSLSDWRAGQQSLFDGNGELIGAGDMMRERALQYLARQLYENEKSRGRDRPYVLDGIDKRCARMEVRSSIPYSSCFVIDREVPARFRVFMDGAGKPDAVCKYTLAEDLNIRREMLAAADARTNGKSGQAPVSGKSSQGLSGKGMIDAIAGTFGGIGLLGGIAMAIRTPNTAWGIWLAALGGAIELLLAVKAYQLRHMASPAIPTAKEPDLLPAAPEVNQPAPRASGSEQAAAAGVSLTKAPTAAPAAPAGASTAQVENKADPSIPEGTLAGEERIELRHRIASRIETAISQESKFDQPALRQVWDEVKGITDFSGMRQALLNEENEIRDNIAGAKINLVMLTPLAAGFVAAAGFFFFVRPRPETILLGALCLVMAAGVVYFNATGGIIQYMQWHKALKADLYVVARLRAIADGIADELNAEIEALRFEIPVRSAGEVTALIRMVNYELARLGRISNKGLVAQAYPQYNELRLYSEWEKQPVLPAVYIGRTALGVIIVFVSSIAGRECHVRYCFEPDRVEAEWTDTSIPDAIIRGTLSKTINIKGYDAFKGFKYEGGIWTINFSPEFLAILEKALEETGVRIPTVVRLAAGVSPIDTSPKALIPEAAYDKAKADVNPVSQSEPALVASVTLMDSLKARLTSAIAIAKGIDVPADFDKVIAATLRIFIGDMEKLSKLNDEDIVVSINRQTGPWGIAGTMPEWMNRYAPQLSLDKERIGLLNRCIAQIKTLAKDIAAASSAKGVTGLHNGDTAVPPTGEIYNATGRCLEDGNYGTVCDWLNQLWGSNYITCNEIRRAVLDSTSCHQFLMSRQYEDLCNFRVGIRQFFVNGMNEIFAAMRLEADKSLRASRLVRLAQDLVSAGSEGTLRDLKTRNTQFNTTLNEETDTGIINTVWADIFRKGTAKNDDPAKETKDKIILAILRALEDRYFELNMPEAPDGQNTPAQAANAIRAILKRSWKVDPKNINVTSSTGGSESAVSVSVDRDSILTFMVRIMPDGAIKTDWTVVKGSWGEIIGEITERNLRVAMKCVPKDILLAMRISATPAPHAAIAEKAGQAPVSATGEGETAHKAAEVRSALTLGKSLEELCGVSRASADRAASGIYRTLLKYESSAPVTLSELTAGAVVERTHAKYKFFICTGAVSNGRIKGVWVSRDAVAPETVPVSDLINYKNISTRINPKILAKLIGNIKSRIVRNRGAQAIRPSPAASAGAAAAAPAAAEETARALENVSESAVTAVEEKRVEDQAGPGHEYTGAGEGIDDNEEVAQPYRAEFEKITVPELAEAALEVLSILKDRPGLDMKTQPSGRIVEISFKHGGGEAGITLNCRRAPGQWTITNWAGSAKATAFDISREEFVAQASQIAREKVGIITEMAVTEIAAAAEEAGQKDRLRDGAPAAKVASQHPLLTVIDEFTAPVAWKEGPGAVKPLTESQLREIYDAVNLFHQEKIEIFIHKAIGISPTMKQAIDDINKNLKSQTADKGGKQAEDIIICPPAFESEAHLAKLLKNPARGKRIIITADGACDADKLIAMGDLLNNTRTINVKLPDNYAGLKTNDKTFYQAWAVNLGILGRLIEPNSGIYVRNALANLLKGSIEGDVNTYIDNLAKPESQWKSPAERVGYFLGKMVRLSYKIAEEYELLRLRMKAFWTAA